METDCGQVLLPAVGESWQPGFAVARPRAKPRVASAIFHRSMFKNTISNLARLRQVAEVLLRVRLRGRGDDHAPAPPGEPEAAACAG
ncbi:MAG: hypothetical protein WKG07_15940 [Hymenobacter sp.]